MRRMRSKYHLVGQADRRTWSVYRLWTCEGTLLYVGNTGRIEDRILCEHSVDKDWFREAERASFEHYDSKEMAEAMERDAIRMEAPLFNVAHNEMSYGVLRERWAETQKQILRKKQDLGWLGWGE
jgi:hypothetical protein